MSALQPIKVGPLEIRYLIDGAADAGLGLFELVVPAAPTPASAS